MFMKNPEDGPARFSKFNWTTFWRVSPAPQTLTRPSRLQPQRRRLTVSASPPVTEPVQLIGSLRLDD